MHRRAGRLRGTGTMRSLSSVRRQKFTMRRAVAIAPGNWAGRGNWRAQYSATFLRSFARRNLERVVANGLAVSHAVEPACPMIPANRRGLRRVLGYVACIVAVA